MKGEVNWFREKVLEPGPAFNIPPLDKLAMTDKATQFRVRRQVGGGDLGQLDKDDLARPGDKN